jgi:hypothetical protein
MDMCRHYRGYVAQVAAGYNITSRIFVGLPKHMHQPGEGLGPVGKDR